MKPGDRKGSLILLRQHTHPNKGGHAWSCWCVCGAFVRVGEGRLMRGMVKTCANRSIHPRNGR